MSNGKDFYVELRKQVTAMQQGGERAGMYISVQIQVSFRIAKRISGVEGSVVPFFEDEMLTPDSPYIRRIR